MELFLQYVIKEQNIYIKNCQQQLILGKLGTFITVNKYEFRKYYGKIILTRDGMIG